jgi:fucose permease
MGTLQARRHMDLRSLFPGICRQRRLVITLVLALSSFPMLLTCITAAISGWIVTFMARIRHTSPYFSSLCSSFFWIGMTVGRLTLGYITDRVGVRVATLMYIIVALALQAIFAFVPNATVSAVMICMIGYFFGPMFPSGVVMLVRTLDRKLHVRAVAFVVSLGQVGGALIPFGLGALAERVGMQVFQIVIFGWLLVTLALWLTFPKLPSARKENRSSEEEEELVGGGQDRDT